MDLDTAVLHDVRPDSPAVVALVDLDAGLTGRRILEDKSGVWMLAAGHLLRFREGCSREFHYIAKIRIRRGFLERIRQMIEEFSDIDCQEMDRLARSREAFL